MGETIHWRASMQLRMSTSNLSDEDDERNYPHIQISHPPLDSTGGSCACSWMFSVYVGDIIQCICHALLLAARMISIHVWRMWLSLLSCRLQQQQQRIGECNPLVLQAPLRNAQHSQIWSIERCNLRNPAWIELRRRQGGTSEVAKTHLLEHKACQR